MSANERKGVLDGIQATDKATGARGRSGGRRGDRSPREKQAAEEEQAYDQAPAEEQAPAEDQEQAASAPPPADPADELEHLAQLHSSGALTDEEFAAAKAKILGT